MPIIRNEAEWRAYMAFIAASQELVDGINDRATEAREEIEAEMGRFQLEAELKQARPLE